MDKIEQFIMLVFASSLLSIANADETKVKEALARSMPNVQVDAIKQSEIQGLYEVLVGTNIFYMSKDGKYIIQGKLLDVEKRKDITEDKLAELRVQALQNLGQDKLILFKPEKEVYRVTVFTDIDCGYCRKLHAEIDTYLDKGIAVQYAFFPRSGKGGESYKKAVAVWCAEDRNKAITAAKQNQPVEPATCENPVDEHMQLAREFNVTGTPLIVTQGGSLYPGYLPAEQLVKALEFETTK